MNRKISIILAGEAGQGIQSIESIIVSVLKKDGFNIFATKEYMSRVRGGVNSTTIIVAENSIDAYYENMDIFIPLSDEALKRYEKNITENTIILADNTQVHHPKITNLPIQRLASELGNVIFSNTIAAGVILGIFNASQEIMNNLIKNLFQKKGEEIVNKNLEAIKIGYNIGNELKNNKVVDININKTGDKNSLLMNGADAIAIGALAGGCNACFAYPMTPSTSVFTNMANYSKNYNIAVEQVEDEIGVINMALGCWYAGGRALVTTSGGGFALMTEGLSLAGMTETPVVIHLAQRPGPATGLPTRTEQGDLNLVLYAGHGVFPRIIFAPGNLKQAFELSAMAFNYADKFQIPVFILSDQYFVDTYYNIPIFDIDNIKKEDFFIKTEKDYKRYKITDDGISPRGIPGFGDGLVAVDSDEHNEEGRITEDLNGISLQMKNKRLRKFKKVEEYALPPVLYGKEDFKNLIICWGSTLNIVLETVKNIKNSDIAVLFFPQVYPLHKSTIEFLNKAKKVIAVENNSTGQFADLIKTITGFEVKTRILKYNGIQFSVEELLVKIKENL